MNNAFIVAMYDKSIETVPEDKPVVYKIFDAEGTLIYAGCADSKSVVHQLKAHLPLGSHPIEGGDKILINQFPRIQEAKHFEQMIVKYNRPKFNRTDRIHGYQTTVRMPA